MKFSIAAVAALSAIGGVAAETFFKEQFNDAEWKDRWTIPSKWKPESEMGEWSHTHGQWYGDEKDLGIQTTGEARFFGLSSKLAKPMNNSGKDLVLQYSVKLEEKMDCGGAYIKILPGDDFDADSFGGDTPYAIMFGPDICGGANKRTHVIVNYEPKGENVLIKKDIPCETDQVTHLYTLVIRADNTFEVFVDNKSVRSGNLEDEFELLAPKEIKDPDQSKPKDWVDEKEIEDPESVKPEGYDDIPAEIPDPEATKPDDWDDEEDGEWEAPLVDNPEYEGPWTPKMIPNPDYKGPWKHPKIANPDYKADPNLHAVCSKGCSHVGFELWQVKTGVLIDDIIVTDNLEEAQKFAEETFFKKKEGEKKMYDEMDEKKRKEEEEARKAAEDEESEEYDDFGEEF